MGAVLFSCCRSFLHTSNMISSGVDCDHVVAEIHEPTLSYPLDNCSLIRNIFLCTNLERCQSSSRNRCEYAPRPILKCGSYPSFAIIRSIEIPPPKKLLTFMLTRRHKQFRRFFERPQHPKGRYESNAAEFLYSFGVNPVSDLNAEANLAGFE